MNFENFKVIPGSYTKGTVSFDQFLTIETKKEIDYVFKKSEDFLIFKSSFLNKEEGWGYTILISPEEKVYLLRSREDEEIEKLRPKFLKGIATTPRVKNDFVNFTLNHYFKNVELFQCNIVEDNVWEIVEATETVDTPSINHSSITSLSQLATL